MKNIYFLPFLIVVLFVHSWDACEAQTTIIAGHFEKSEDRIATLKYFLTPLDFINNKWITEEVLLDDEKNFKFIVETNQTLQFHLLNGTDWLMVNKYAAPGDSLWIVDKAESMEVDGNCSECLKMMFEWDEKFFKDSKQKRAFNEVYRELDAMAFAEYWNKRRIDQLSYIDDYFKGNKLPENFQRHMRKEVDYDFLTAMIQYTWRGVSGRNVLNNPEYLAYLKPVKLDDSNSLSHARYLFLLGELPNCFWKTGIDFYDKSTFTSNIYLNRVQIRDSFARLFYTGISYDLALYQNIKAELRSLDHLKGRDGFDQRFDEITGWLNKYQNNFNDATYYDDLVKKLALVKDSTQLAPNFTLKNLNGGTTTLSDIKGKVVYIEFWATNCAPCVKEIPDAKELKERFKTENVVFLNISLDHSEEVLAGFLKNRGFDGNHLIAPKGMASQVAMDYSVQSIPRIVIIDKNGLIVNSNAPRPSLKPDDLLKKLLEK